MALMQLPPMASIGAGGPGSAGADDPDAARVAAAVVVALRLAAGSPGEPAPPRLRPVRWTEAPFACPRSWRKVR
jgi:hypothetical protein